MQKLQNQAGSQKDEVADLSDDLETCRETLEKRNTDLSILRGELFVLLYGSTMAMPIPLFVTFYYLSLHGAFKNVECKFLSFKDM